VAFLARRFARLPFEILIVVPTHAELYPVGRVLELGIILPAIIVHFDMKRRASQLQLDRGYPWNASVDPKAEIRNSERTESPLGVRVSGEYATHLRGEAPATKEGSMRMVRQTVSSS